MVKKAPVAVAKAAQPIPNQGIKDRLSIGSTVIVPLGISKTSGTAVPVTNGWLSTSLVVVRAALVAGFWADALGATVFCGAPAPAPV